MARQPPQAPPDGPAPGGGTMSRPHLHRPALADPEPSGGHVIEPMLSLDNVARILKCSRRWLEGQRSAGKVPRPDFMAGRCPRWKPSTIRRWIEEGRQS